MKHGGDAIEPRFAGLRVARLDVPPGDGDAKGGP
jgi:hypothetical protein